MNKKDSKPEGKTDEPSHTQEVIDEALDETFPASDPPATTTTTDDLDKKQDKDEGKGD